jgi:hypothetical protein
MIRTAPFLAKAACSAMLVGALGVASAQTPQPAATAAQSPAAVEAAAKPATKAATKPATKPPAKPAVKAVPANVRTNLAKQVPARAHMLYEGIWGVDSLTVKYTESGELIRFSYRVTDPDKAATLSNDKAEPSLIDPEAGVKLVVPQMANIGKLRQSGPPTVGKSYWIAFSNSGRRVRPGHRVDVEIGNFRAQGLVVE